MQHICCAYAHILQHLHQVFNENEAEKAGKKVGTEIAIVKDKRNKRKKEHERHGLHELT